MTKKSLLKGAAVLAAAGIIVKILGAFFRIPLANYIGSEGMANYAPAYALYAFLVVFATAGLPVAISKMVSERYAVGQYREAERVFKLSRTLMFVIGIIGFCLLFFFSDIISELFHVPGSALSMKATAPALLLVPIMSSYRGYFQGMQTMSPTAVSQVIEQVFRVVFGLTLAYVLANSVTFAMDFSREERGAAGGCFGASVGAMGGLITMVIIYFAVRKNIKGRVTGDVTTQREAAGSILKKMAIIAIPITIGAAIMPLVNLVDASIVNVRLAASGWEETAAKDLYGQLTGFAAPLVAFPQILISAIVVSLVPMVSAAHKLRNRKELNDSISLGSRMAMIIAFPCAMGMIVLAEPILMLLYPAQKASAISAAPCLQTLAIAFIFLAVISIMTAALQGIGKQTIPVINLFIGVLVKVAVTWALTAVPSINIVGAAIGTMVAYITAAALDFAAVKRFTGVRLSATLTIIKPLLSALFMGVVVFFAYKGVYMLLGSNGTATLISIMVGVIVYGLMILRTKAVERNEVITLPMGRKLAAICDKLRLW